MDDHSKHKQLFAVMETGYNNKLAFVSLPNKIIPLLCVQVVSGKWMNLVFCFLKFLFTQSYFFKPFSLYF